MKIYKITEASEYLGVSINTLKTLANNGKIKSFKTSGSHRRFRQDGLDAYMGVEKEKQEKLTVIYARCSTAKQKENLERQKDRLARFGYEYLDAIFKNLEITVEIVEAKEKKYEEELAEDIMKILTCYSARYYGRRGGRKKKNQTVESNGI